MDFETALRSVSGTSLGDSEGLQESQAHRRTVPIDENCKASVSHPCSAGFPVSTPENSKQRSSAEEWLGPGLGLVVTPQVPHDQALGLRFGSKTSEARSCQRRQLGGLQHVTAPSPREKQANRASTSTISPAHLRLVSLKLILRSATFRTCCRGLWALALL